MGELGTELCRLSGAGKEMAKREVGGWGRWAVLFGHGGDRVGKAIETSLHEV